MDVALESNGHSWRVMKRYHEFDDLAGSVGLRAKFPRKHLTACTGAKLERRRKKLEYWLRLALLHQHGNAGMRAPLRDFLGADEFPTSPAVQPFDDEKLSDAISSWPVACLQVMTKW